MSRSLLVLLLALAAGAAGAAVSVLLSPHSSSRPPEDLARKVARLVEEIGALDAAHRDLAEEVRRISLAPPLPAGTPASPEEPVEESGTAPAPGPAAASATPDSIDEKVRTAVAASREAELERIGNRFSSMARQREFAALDRFSNSNGLSPYQREEMEKLLDRRREAIGAFFRTLFGGGEADPAAIREKVADVQRETDEALRSLLTPEQYDEWKKVDEAALRSPFGPPMGGPR